MESRNAKRYVGIEKMTAYHRAKGSKNVRRAMNLLEHGGWLVGKCELGGKFTKEKDLYGLYDLVCTIPNIVMYVQVTSNKPHAHWKYQEFADKYAGPNLIVVQLVWVDGVGFTEYRYYPNGPKRVCTFHDTSISDKRGNNAKATKV
jgi:hypothetical protein